MKMDMKMDMKMKMKMKERNVVGRGEEGLLSDLGDPGSELYYY